MGVHCAQRPLGADEQRACVRRDGEGMRLFVGFEHYAVAVDVWAVRLAPPRYVPLTGARRRWHQIGGGHTEAREGSPENREASQLAAYWPAGNFHFRAVARNAEAHVGAIVGYSREQAIANPACRIEHAQRRFVGCERDGLISSDRKIADTAFCYECAIRQRRAGNTPAEHCRSLALERLTRCVQRRGIR